MRRLPFATTLVPVVLGILATPAPAAVTAFGDAVDQQGYVGVAVGPDGSAYVYNDVDSTIERYDRSGALVASWGGRSATGVPGKFHDLIGVTVTPAGTVWASENTGGRLQRFGANGTYEGVLNNAAGRELASSATGALYGSDWTTVARYDAAGVLQGTFGALGAGDGEFGTLRDLDVDRATGTVFTIDDDHERVQAFDADGTFLRKWGSPGTGAGQFRNAWSIAAGPAGVFVGESDNARSRIQQFTADGTLLGELAIGDLGVQPNVSDLALDGDQLVVVGGHQQAYRIDIGKPLARIAPLQITPWAGNTVQLDASRSLLPFGDDGALRYTWDLDGDGTFETDTGATPNATHTVRGGDNVVRVRVTHGADSDVATMTFTAGTVIVGGPGPAPGPGGPTPPAGPVGVTVNDGAQYTNDPSVTVDLVWPLGASTLLVANDGGFRAAKALPLAPQVTWTLASSGPERLPKTVYVRFGGAQTFTDDIILDQTPPKLATASFSAGRAKASAAAKRKAKSRTLRLRASDKTSGVKQVELAASRGGKVLQRAAYRTKVKVTKSAVKWARVTDGAGNRSAWRRISR